MVRVEHTQILLEAQRLEFEHKIETIKSIKNKST